MKSSRQRKRGWGFPRQGLRLDQMRRTMDPKDLRKGRGEGALQSDPTGPSLQLLAEPLAPSGGQREQKLPSGQCESSNHRRNELYQLRYPYPNNIIVCDLGPELGQGILYIVLSNPHHFLQGGQLFCSPPHFEDEGVDAQGGQSFVPENPADKLQSQNSNPCHFSLCGFSTNNSCFPERQTWGQS